MAASSPSTASMMPGMSMPISSSAAALAGTAASTGGVMVPTSTGSAPIASFTGAAAGKARAGAGAVAVVAAAGLVAAGML